MESSALKGISDYKHTHLRLSHLHYNKTPILNGAK